MGVQGQFNQSGNGQKQNVTLRRTPHDWPTIQQYYIQDESLPSYRATCRHFKVNMATLIKHANHGEWQKRREEYWEGVQKEVFDKVKIFQVANRVQRFKKVSKAVNDIIKSLSRKTKINEATVTDLSRLMDIEAHLVQGAIGQDGVSEETMTEIVEAQIIRIRKISGDRRVNFDHVLNSGLRRLGLIEGETSGDGPDAERQGVRVRPPSS